METAALVKEGDALLTEATRRYDRAAAQLQGAVSSAGGALPDAAPAELNDARRSVANAKVLREAVVSSTSR